MPRDRSLRGRAAAAADGQGRDSGDQEQHAQLIRLRRPGSQIISIDARLTTAPAAIIPLGSALREPVDEGPSVSHQSGLQRSSADCSDRRREGASHSGRQAAAAERYVPV